GVRAAALVQYDDRLDMLAPLLVGGADHRGLAHGRMLEQRAFHVPWIDVEAARHDHVLLAIHDSDEAFAIHARHVAGMQPAVAKRTRGSARIVEVAAHHVWRAHHDLAGLSGRRILTIIVEQTYLGGVCGSTGAGQDFDLTGRIFDDVIFTLPRDERHRRFRLSEELGEYRAEALNGLLQALWCDRRGAVQNVA